LKKGAREENNAMPLVESRFLFVSVLFKEEFKK
jgi:hypothetical protein